MRIELLIIDPQISFCDPDGELFVPGADEDMKRLATMINRLKSKIKKKSDLNYMRSIRSVTCVNHLSNCFLIVYYLPIAAVASNKQHVASGIV